MIILEDTEKKIKNAIRVNDEDWNKPIYRIFSENYFFTLLGKKLNGLVRPSKWDDPMENFFLKCRVQIPETGEIGTMESIENSWYGQCWTSNPESDAMWRIYSPNKNGIKIRTTINKLFDNFFDVNDEFKTNKYFIGIVEYKERLEIENILKNTSFTNLAFGGRATPFAETLLVKRKAFDHEEEVRLLFHDANKEHEGKEVVEFLFDFENVVDEIILDPRLESNAVSALKRRIEKQYNFIPVNQSDLYKVEPGIIQL